MHTCPCSAACFRSGLACPAWLLVLGARPCVGCQPTQPLQRATGCPGLQWRLGARCCSRCEACSCCSASLPAEPTAGVQHTGSCTWHVHAPHQRLPRSLCLLPLHAPACASSPGPSVPVAAPTLPCVVRPGQSQLTRVRGPVAGLADWSGRQHALGLGRQHPLPASHPLHGLGRSRCVCRGSVCSALYVFGALCDIEGPLGHARVLTCPSAQPPSLSL